jgi:hypothetical protein
MKLIDFTKIFIKRIKGETPVFFKIIRRFGNMCTAIGVGLMAVKTQYDLNFINSVYCGYAITAGVVIAAVCSLPVVDNSSADSTDPK